MFVFVFVMANIQALRICHTLQKENSSNQNFVWKFIIFVKEKFQLLVAKILGEAHGKWGTQVSL